MHEQYTEKFRATTRKSVTCGLCGHCGTIEQYYTSRLCLSAVCAQLFDSPSMIVIAVSFTSLWCVHCGSEQQLLQCLSLSLKRLSIGPSVAKYAKRRDANTTDTRLDVRSVQSVGCVTGSSISITIGP